MGLEEVDLTGDAPVAAPSRKRKAKDISNGPPPAFASSSGIGNRSFQTIDLTGDDDDQDIVSARPGKSKRKRKSKHDEDEEESEKPKQSKKGGKAAGGDDGEKRLRKYDSSH
jgi:hypothetical protein